ncbi:MAG: hypothetical protein AMJ55_06700 [Gammaproteobacteria bacterium SG8_15]|nr:MAG: hypothetical protein AMJ55_06700 [Gammaproteobacteria bacterium SG8_15]
MKRADQGRLLVYVGVNIALSILFYWKIVTEFGATAESDVFFFSMMIPNFIISLLGGVLVNVTVPVLINEGKGVEKEVITGMLLLIGLPVALLSILLAVTSSIWITWLGPGFSPAERDLVLSILPVQFLTGTVSVWVSIYTALYYAQNNFIVFEKLSVFGNLVSLALIFLFAERFQVTGLALAYCSKFLFLLVSLRILARFGVGKDVGLGVAKTVIRRLKPLVFSSLIYKTEEPIEKVLLSTAPRGELTIYHMGMQLYIIVQILYSRVIINPLISELSASLERRDWQSYRKSILSSLKLILLVNIVGLGLFVLIGEPVLQVVFPYDRLTAEDVTQLWWVMLYLAGYLVGGSIGQISISGFYAVGDTVTPAVIGITGFIFGIVLKFIFFMNYGVIGLALATTIYCVITSTVSFFFLAYKISKKEPGLVGEKNIR